MSRYIVSLKMMVVIDSEAEPDVVSDNLYARLSELVQSEDHMLSADIETFVLPEL